MQFVFCMKILEQLFWREAVETRECPSRATRGGRAPGGPVSPAPGTTPCYVTIAGITRGALSV